MAECDLLDEVDTAEDCPRARVDDVVADDAARRTEDDDRSVRRVIDSLRSPGGEESALDAAGALEEAREVRRTLPSTTEFMQARLMPSLRGLPQSGLFSSVPS
jgi:hypothetical protein